MTPRPHILIIARQFPPDASVGVHRVAGLARHLAAEGWQVTVIAARSAPGTAADETLLAAVPASVRVVRTAALDLPGIAARLRGRKAGPAPAAPPAKGVSEQAPVAKRGLRRAVDWLSCWLHVPDSHLGWFPAALWAAIREGRRERPSVIFSSAPVWTAHLVAAVAARVLRVPVVADFRDPWCGSVFRDQKVPYAAHRRANDLLERFVVATARRITCAWDGIRRQLANRYPARAGQIQTVLNGFDPQVLEDAEPVRLETSRRVFLHAGSFYGPRSPLPLFDALRLLGSGPENAEILVALVGSEVYKGRSLAELVQQHGLEQQVRVVGRVCHRESIGLLKGAEAAILCGQSGAEELASIPAKAYEYIGAGKAVLAIGAGDEVCEVLRQGGCRVWRAPAEAPEQIAAAMRQMLACLSRDLADPPSPDRQQFTRRQMAIRLEGILREAMAATPARSRAAANSCGETASAIHNHPKPE